MLKPRTEIQMLKSYDDWLDECLENGGIAEYPNITMLGNYICNEQVIVAMDRELLYKALWIFDCYLTEEDDKTKT